MRHRIGLSKCAPWLMLAMALATATTADAASPVVTLGEVTTAAPSDMDAKWFEGVVRDELRQLPLAGRRGRYVLSASLVQLRADVDGRGAEARAVVSATLRRRGEGSLVAMLRGQGRATADADELDETRQAVVRAAVHSAVSRVPEAVGR